ncbi:MBL fold metallo-hydrolase [Paenibacillus albiflavus]|uniref:MBL fold metallo-hydrolase n=1 Tax=Paenibacillus albiflavus TaxID=2545760 RepID=A0A4R4EFC8_9BACL|nr:MBL fold metallo-hydrolase [Paenibacillus albiflavus]TCZ78267.1 MBL fold metallo-hydrolase [Paenibacillus albiflavus]
MSTLQFLGTGDAMGVPRIYCSCEVCMEARQTGVNRRYRSSVLLRTDEGNLLIDCGPDWREQMERLGFRGMERALITHAHNDHVAGLTDWADACRWTKHKGTVYAPLEVFTIIQRQYPWIKHQLNFIELDSFQSTGQLFTFGGWAISWYKVCHGHNGYSYAYRFTQGEYSFAYCSDAINLSSDQKAFLTGLDLLILGTSFYYEEAEFTSRSVYDMVEAEQLNQELRAKQMIYTHMGHGVDIQRSYALPSNVQLAKTGMQVHLP